VLLYVGASGATGATGPRGGRGPQGAGGGGGATGRRGSFGRQGDTGMIGDTGIAGMLDTHSLQSSSPRRASSVSQAQIFWGRARGGREGAEVVKCPPPRGGAQQGRIKLLWSPVPNRVGARAHIIR